MILTSQTLPAVQKKGIQKPTTMLYPLQQPAPQQPPHQQPPPQQPSHQQPPHQQPLHQQPAHQQPPHHIELGIPLLRRAEGFQTRETSAEKTAKVCDEKLNKGSK